MPSAVILHNLLASATLSSSTADAVYGLPYLYDEVLARPFRFASSSGGWIEIDLGESTAVDAVAILNHNLAATATVVLKSGATPAPSATLATITWREANMWAALTDPEHRYYRLEIADANSEATEIGELVLGKRIQLPRSRRWGQKPGRQRSDIMLETEHGVKHVYERFQREVRDYAWRVLESELKPFTDLDSQLRGRLNPFVWIPDTSAREAFLARRTASDFRPAELDDHLEAYDVNWSVEEESRGAAIGV